MSRRRHRHQQQQEVQPRAEEEPSIGTQPGRFAVALEERDYFPKEGRTPALSPVAIQEGGLF